MTDVCNRPGCHAHVTAGEMIRRDCWYELETPVRIRLRPTWLHGSVAEFSEALDWALREWTAGDEAIDLAADEDPS